MQHSKLTECYEILRRKVFFFTKEDLRAKLACFETFQVSGKPQDIIFISQFLKNSNKELRIAALETIIILFQKMKTQTDFYSSLKYADISTADLDYFKTTFSPAQYQYLFLIATLNLSGYVREKALVELTAKPDSAVLKFIIFRLSDWVINVREAAFKALDQYFQPQFLDDFLNLLPLLEWLLTVQRADLLKVYNDIYGFIFAADSFENIYRKLQNSDEKIKLIYVRNYLKSNELTKNVSELLANDNHYLLKLELLKHIAKLDAETQKVFVRKFLKDRSAKVRLHALYSTKPFRDEFSVEIFEAIFDTSAPVREVSRFILRESVTDFAEIYRRKLNENETSVGAISGLSEVCKSEDLSIFEKMIQSPTIKVIVACLHGTNKLNGALGKEYALKFLTHSSAKVRTKSIEILTAKIDENVLETARRIFHNGDYETKKSILRMFARIGGWKIIGDLIIAVGDADERIQDLGWLFLENWRNTQNYIKPIAEDVARANRLYKEIDNAKLEFNHYREKFWRELPFYLR